jgi:uncharacterized protein YndB with AHSA1/START domain
MHFEASLVVKVPRGEAYSAYTDFEAMPKWSKDKHEVKVSRREGNIVHLQSTSGTGGPQRDRVMAVFPPERVESEGETRFTRTRSVVRFEEVPEGTKVTASLDVELKGRWSWVFKTHGRSEVESSALAELGSFAAYVEGLERQPNPTAQA